MQLDLMPEKTKESCDSIRWSNKSGAKAKSDYLKKKNTSTVAVDPQILKVEVAV